MKRWAAFLLAAVHGIDAVAIDCSHRTRRICRPDRECVAGAQASRPRHHSPRRVAVLLRGVAFRNWGSRGTEGSCCNGTETQQRAVVESLDERLFAPLEARGFEVSVYLSTSVWKSTSVSRAPDNSSLSHFSAMTWPCWLRRAVRNRHRHAVEQGTALRPRSRKLPVGVLLRL